MKEMTCFCPQCRNLYRAWSHNPDAVEAPRTHEGTVILTCVTCQGPIAQVDVPAPFPNWLEELINANDTPELYCHLCHFPMPIAEAHCDAHGYKALCTACNDRLTIHGETPNEMVLRTSPIDNLLPFTLTEIQQLQAEGVLS